MEVDRELAVPWSNLHPQVDMTWLHEFHKSQVDIRQSSKTLAILSIPYPWGKKKKNKPGSCRMWGELPGVRSQED